ncbi:hypothetical protein RBB74_06435 [Tunturiibacter gelidiferens]
MSSNLHQLPFELHRIVGEAPARRSKVEMTIGLDLGDVWSHYCTLNEEGEVIDQGRFRTSPKGVEKWFKRLTETEYTETQALIKVYGVGQLTALTYVLTLGSKERFHRSRDVGCYLAALSDILRHLYDILLTKPLCDCIEAAVKDFLLVQQRNAVNNAAKNIPGAIPIPLSYRQHRPQSLPRYNDIMIALESTRRK